MDPKYLAGLDKLSLEHCSEHKWALAITEPSILGRGMLRIKCRNCDGKGSIGMFRWYKRGFD